MIRTCIIAASFLLGSSALAADNDIYAWASPPSDAQLSDDTSPVPLGKGALFIPSLSASSMEPQVIIVGKEGVVKAPTGRKVVLKPGAYVVLAGSSEPAQAQGVEVLVQEGRTTVVKPVWGGLRVEVVNRHLAPKNARYDLVHVDSGAIIELPDDLKHDDEARPDTYLLAPGLYRLQEAGDSVSAVTSPTFATVHVPEGGLVHFRLFVNSAGSVKGGGVIPMDQVLDREVKRSNWDPSLIVGAQGAAFQYQNQPGFPDLTVIDASAFAEFDIDYQDDRNLISIGAEAQYGTLILTPGSGEALPWIKSRDRLMADANYTFLLNEGVGIYARVKGRTQMTNTNAIATERQDIAFRNLNGQIDRLQVPAASEYKIADSFKPMIGIGSAGARVRVLAYRDLDLSLFAGAGYKIMNFGGGYAATDNLDTNTIEYTQLADFGELGFELGASTMIRVNGFMNLESELDLFQAFDGTGGLMTTWDNDLNFRITKALSVAYNLNASRIDWISEDLQIRQGASLRFAFALL